ncbi:MULTISPECIES: hypothetical protein [Paenibacillus]|jgi:hypothetical protein|uniref:DUF5683 domain-containing protein n=1 Tax=Paenibacillus borealis TaxID=160799 RepID=A0ABX3H376_PAEBO|nr:MULTISPECIES: hypothetical protein [Paenibacillus]AIQ16497.1 hypothetical protein H70357_07255 [Paenibacillus sp. FSL H7-0357]OMD44872.1 hypothetical protein BSK56_21265 [Paenibacillus borealis]
MIKKRRWLTFLLAMVPGIGHLYLGFKKLGLQYMIGASLCIILIPSMPTVFPFALAALWFYQLFDALQKAAWMKVSAAEHERMMFHPDSFGAPWTMGMPAAPDYPHDDLNPVWVGIGCVVVGFLLLLITAFPWLWHILTDMNIGAILLSLGLIGYGLSMLRKNPKV